MLKYIVVFAGASLLAISLPAKAQESQYAEMVREAYRNYRHNNYLTYIFSSRDFADMARKLTNLREVASMRERKLQDRCV